MSFCTDGNAQVHGMLRAIVSKAVRRQGDCECDGMASQTKGQLWWSGRREMKREEDRLVRILCSL